MLHVRMYVYTYIRIYTDIYVCIFVDNNKNLSSLSIEKIKIYSPKYLSSNLTKLTNHAVIICDNRIPVIKSINKQLKIIGFKNKNILPFDIL